VVLGYDITILIEDPEFEPTLSAPIQHDLMGMEDDGATKEQNINQAAKKHKSSKFL
jgi:hypothetical protein